MKSLLVGAIVVAVAVLVAWLFDVFTPTGLAYAFLPWANAGSLWWPLGTRLVWWGLCLETTVAVVAMLVWREGRLECATGRDLWLAAHVSLAQRLYRRSVFAVEGAKVAIEQHRRHRPTTVEQPVVAADEVRDTTSEERAA